MNRREALFSLLALGPIAAQAQQAGKGWRVGVLRAAPDDAVFGANLDHFTHALREGGFTEGTNLVIERRVRSGMPQEILAMASDLVHAKVNAILAIAAPGVSAAAKATTSIPIVAVDLESDPIASGFAQSLARPGGNITGLFLDFPQLSGKWIELLKQGLPNLTRVAVLRDPATGPYLVKGAEAAGVSMGVQIVLLEAHGRADLERAFHSMGSQKVGALLALSSPVFNSARKDIVALALKHKLPAIMPFPGFADDGGLMAYGPHLSSLFRQAGSVMVKVLQGARPQAIPIERPTRFEFAINLRTAKSFGIAIPPTLMLRADRVIE
jgi:putative tryptophan/tyrosine transport system substrate-binding protein